MRKPNPIYKISRALFRESPILLQIHRSKLMMFVVDHPWKSSILAAVFGLFLLLAPQLGWVVICTVAFGAGVWHQDYKLALGALCSMVIVPAAIVVLRVAFWLAPLWFPVLLFLWFKHCLFCYTPKPHIDATTKWKLTSLKNSGYRSEHDSSHGE